jgi:hypothetical protein
VHENAVPKEFLIGEKSARGGVATPAGGEGCANRCGVPCGAGGANIAGVGNPLVYGLLEIGLTFVKSGDHATLAGVLLTMTDDQFFGKLW